MWKSFGNLGNQDIGKKKIRERERYTRCREKYCVESEIMIMVITFGIW